MSSSRKLYVVYWLALHMLSVRTKPLKRPCSGSQTIDILGLAMRENVNLRSGFEITSDGERKGYRFNPASLVASVEADDILGHCNSFPTEFSIVLSFKSTSEKTNSEYLLSLLGPDRETILISVRTKDNWLLLDYIDAYNMRRSVGVKSKNLKDAKWHDLVVAVSESDASFTWDCGLTVHRNLPQKFREDLNLKKSRFYVGSRRKKRGRFTGIMQQAKFVIGSDASLLQCRSPSDTDFPPWLQHRRPGKDSMLGLVEVEDGKSECSYKTKGHLVFRYGTRQLEVCEGSKWERIVTGDERLDYIDEYSNLQTKSKTLDFELFRLPGKGLFMAAANQGRDRDMDSTIYKWTDDRFVPYQNLTTDMAQDWEYFQIGDDYFLACANQGADEHSPHATSTVYRWSETRRKFIPHQYFRSNAAQSFESFTIFGKNYLAIANYGGTQLSGDSNGSFSPSLVQKSVIYEWNPSQRAFVIYQTISTTGCVDLEYFEAYGNHYLAAANSFNGDDSRIHSVIYQWQHSQFVPVQYIETIGAQDVEHFQIGNRHFLAVANYYDYRKKSYAINSTIYQLAESGLRFSKIQEIPTVGALDWEYFKIGKDSFIIAGSSSDSNTRIANTVYRWRGVEHFVPVHSLSVFPSSDWEMFNSEDGKKFLVTANLKGKNNKVLKIVTY